jgi:hypothetical protein
MAIQHCYPIHHTLLFFHLAHHVVHQASGNTHCGRPHFISRY